MQVLLAARSLIAISFAGMAYVRDWRNRVVPFLVLHGLAWLGWLSPLDGFDPGFATGSCAGRTNEMTIMPMPHIELTLLTNVSWAKPGTSSTRAKRMA